MSLALRSKEFKAKVYSEGSWGTDPLSPEADHSMELHQTGVDRFMIEWTCEELEVYETIGIWVEDNKLTDYDGVMSLPKEAAELLREHGIEVSDDFE